MKIRLLAKTLPLFLLVILHKVYAAQSVEPVDSASSTLIIYESQTQSKSSEGGSGRSRSRSVIVERAVGKRDDGLEVEYFFPATDIPENDAWKLPARVLIKQDSSIELINKTEIETRLNDYLEKHPEIRKQCGGVVFTWTVFEMHCNTSHVIDLISRYNLHLGTLSEGRLYEEPGALAPVPLKRISSGGTNLVFQAKLVLDPKTIQAEYQTDIEQVAKITGESVRSIIDSSLKLTDNEHPKFSGTMLVTVEATTSGLIVELQRETVTIILGGGTFQETRTKKETLKRQLVK